jgi:Holliday junction DNA helicase RuvA
MIGMLSGTCLLSGKGEAILDVNGVGYLLSCGSRTLSNLREGESARLHVETHVREQAITLFGFGTEEERAWFVRLQSVQGVGPKAALAILDILTPGQILSAASLEDKASFARASGVGPKLAARIAIELSGKPAPAGRLFAGAFTAPSDQAASGAQRAEGLSDMVLRNDAISALQNLGIGQSDALRAVASAYGKFESDPPLDDLIKAALKELSA